MKRCRDGGGTMVPEIPHALRSCMAHPIKLATPVMLVGVRADMYSMPGAQSSQDLRIRAVEAVRRGMPIAEVAAAMCMNRSTVFRWVKRFGDAGIDGLLRRPGSGRPRKLEYLTEKSLFSLVLK